MHRLRIGVVVESFRIGVRQGMKMAARLGLSGVQIDVTGGDLAPERLGRSARRDLASTARSYGLEISALGGNFGRGGFANPDHIDEVVGRMRRIVDMAADLDAPVVATHVGRLPDGDSSPTQAMMVEALNDVGRYAENRERFLATETGAEEPARLLEFLESLSTEAIKVNYDPGNLAMGGFDPVAGVFTLKDRIVHTHANDGGQSPDGSRQEMRLGEGDVDWLPYVAALDSVGYEGFYTIEQTAGEDPTADVMHAKQFLEKF